MKSFIVPMLLTLLLVSCASVEETVDHDADDVSERIETEDKAFPGWFPIRVPGLTENGTLSGLASSTDSNSSRAVEHAKEQAKVNLRVWIDVQLEHARSAIASDDARADHRSFLIALRNAASGIDLDSADIQTHYMEEKGTYHALARVDLPVSEVMAQLEQQLSGEGELWQLLKQAVPMKDWE